MGSMGKSDRRAEDMQPPATGETELMVEGLCLNSFTAVSKPGQRGPETAGRVYCWRPFALILLTSETATGNAREALRRQLWLRLAYPRPSWRISIGRPDSQPCRCSRVWPASRPTQNDGLQDLLRPDSAAPGLISATTLTRPELPRLRPASLTGPRPHTYPSHRPTHTSPTHPPPHPPTPTAPHSPIPPPPLTHPIRTSPPKLWLNHTHIHTHTLSPLSPPPPLPHPSNPTTSPPTHPPPSSLTRPPPPTHSPAHRLFLQRLRTSTATHPAPRGWLPCPLRSENRLGGKNTGPNGLQDVLAHEVSLQTRPTSSMLGPPSGSRLRTAAGDGGAQEARWRGRPLHCTDRQPAAGFGRLRVGGAQDAHWHGRPLDCTGRQPAAGFGRLREVARRELAAGNDLSTARAANRQPAPNGRRGVAHWKLVDMDDLSTARAANRQPAPAGCWGVSRRKLAGVVALYTARAANWQLAPAGCEGVAYRTLADV